MRFLFIVLASIIICASRIFSAEISNQSSESLPATPTAEQASENFLSFKAYSDYLSAPLSPNELEDIFDVNSQLVIQTDVDIARLQLIEQFREENLRSANAVSINPESSQITLKNVQKVLEESIIRSEFEIRFNFFMPKVIELIKQRYDSFFQKTIDEVKANGEIISLLKTPTPTGEERSRQFGMLVDLCVESIIAQVKNNATERGSMSNSNEIHVREYLNEDIFERIFNDEEDKFVMLAGPLAVSFHSQIISGFQTIFISVNEIIMTRVESMKLRSDAECAGDK